MRKYASMPVPTVQPDGKAGTDCPQRHPANHKRTGYDLRADRGPAPKSAKKMRAATLALLNACVGLCLLIACPSTIYALELTFIAASSAKLDNPHDLKLSPDGKHLYVSDVGNNRVAILDPRTLEFITAFGQDHQSGTHDIDFDDQGRAYVADTHNNRVTIYDIETRGSDVRATLTGELSERIRGPEGVLVHPNGHVYVAGAWSNNVVSYRNNKIVNTLEGLSSPHDLELAPDGNIWLADAGNDRMLLLSPELAILHELKGPAYEFNGVRYQDILPDGTIIAADKNSHSIKIITPDHRLKNVIGTKNKPGKGPNKFKTPEGVEVDGKTVWFSDSGNNRVVKYKIK